MADPGSRPVTRELASRQTGTIKYTTLVKLDMREFIDAIDVVRKRIKEHKKSLIGNEAMTRYALIDPILKALDWDVSDPGIVTPEDKGSAGSIDYLMGKGMVVEAKKLDEPLDKHADQLIKYVKETKVRYGVLTNGRRWRLYDSQESMRSVKTEFNVTDTIDVVIRNATSLHRLVIEEKIGPNPPPIPPNVLPIKEIKYRASMAPPTKLVLPDGPVAVKSWTGVIVGVAEWLVEKKHLDETHCPIPSGPKNLLLNTEPVHQDGNKKFTSYKQVGHLYLNTDAITQSVGPYSVKLIEAAKLDPADFFVSFADSEES